jgi:hypothetical protein
MHCASHPDQAAVALCQGCQCGLCASCAAAFEQPACADCVLAHNQRVIRRFSRNLALMAVLGIASVAMCWGVLQPMYLALLGAAAAFSPWGWEFLARMGLASRVEYVSPVAQLSNVLLQLVFSMVVGVFVGPYQIYVAVAEIQNARSTNRQIEEARAGAY